MKRLFTLLLLLPACAWAQQPKDFQLQGTLKTTKPVEWVYLTYRTEGNVVNDSFQLKGGKFTYKGKISEPVLATLRVKYGVPDGLSLNKTERMSLFLQAGKISVEVKDSLKNNRVKGSAAHNAYLALTNLEQPYDNALQELYAQYAQYGKDNDKAGQNAVVKKIDSVDNLVKERVYKTFIEQQPASPVALYALKQYAGYDIDADKTEPLFLTLPEATRHWPSAVEFGEQLEIAKKTGIGKYAMDFTQTDTSGHPVSLSSFKGKYVLVDFWASWCGPCRRENPNVVKVFNQYKDKGFTVLGVSLDRPNARDKWLKAIADDGLTWTQVSDLQFWDNAVAKQYGIKAIPQNLLLDREGKIIAKNLRGEDLEKKLGELLAP